MTNRLTEAAATRAARRLVLSATGQWSLRDASAALPAGWRLSDAADDNCFFPLTVGNVTRAFRAYAQPVE